MGVHEQRAQLERPTGGVLDRWSVRGGRARNDADAGTTADILDHPRGRPSTAYTIEVSVAADAAVRFQWRFDPVSERRTTLTQRVQLCGDGAATLVDTIRAAFEPNLASGMQRVARMMTERAAQDP